MDGVKTLKQQREELYTEYEYLAKSFLLIFYLIKSDYSKVKVVLKKDGEEIGRTYNIEILVALLIMDLFYKCKGKGENKLDRKDLIIAWGIAFDNNCSYGKKQRKRLKIIQPSDYRNCFYPPKKERKNKFKYEYLDRNSFFKLAQYVPEDMLYDYIDKFLFNLKHTEELPEEGVTISDEVKKHIEFFKDAFADFARSLREGNNNRTILQSKFGYDDADKIKDGYKVIQIRLNEEGEKEARETFDRLKDKIKENNDWAIDNGIPPYIPDEMDFYDSNLMYEYGVRKDLMGNPETQKKVKDKIKEILNLKPLDGITYEKQPLR